MRRQAAILNYELDISSKYARNESFRISRLLTLPPSLQYIVGMSFYGS